MRHLAHGLGSPQVTVGQEFSPCVVDAILIRASASSQLRDTSLWRKPNHNRNAGERTNPRAAVNSIVGGPEVDAACATGLQATGAPNRWVGSLVVEGVRG